MTGKVDLSKIPHVVKYFWDIKYAVDVDNAIKI